MAKLADYLGLGEGGRGHDTDGLVVVVPLLALVVSNSLGLNFLSTLITVMVVSVAAAPLHVLAVAMKDRRSHHG